MQNLPWIICASALLMDSLPPTTRRANRWLLAALLTFAVALAVACFLWMRVVVRNNGGIVDPQPQGKTSMLQRTLGPAGDFVLPTTPPCLT